MQPDSSFVSKSVQMDENELHFSRGMPLSEGLAGVDLCLAKIPCDVVTKAKRSVKFCARGRVVLFCVCLVLNVSIVRSF